MSRGIHIGMASSHLFFKIHDEQDEQWSFHSMFCKIGRLNKWTTTWMNRSHYQDLLLNSYQIGQIETFEVMMEGNSGMFCWQLSTNIVFLQWIFVSIILLAVGNGNLKPSTTNVWGISFSHRHRCFDTLNFQEKSQNLSTDSMNGSIGCFLPVVKFSGFRKNASCRWVFLPSFFSKSL